MAPTIRNAVTEAIAAVIGSTQDITISGFGTPQAAMFFGSRYDEDVNTQVANNHLFIGATDGTRNWLCGHGDDDHSSPSSIWITADDGKCAKIAFNPGNTDGMASFTSWITNGIRLTWDSGIATRYFGVLFFNGFDNVYAGWADLTGTSQDSALNITDPGFRPDLLFVTGLENIASDNDDFGTAIISRGLVTRDNSGTIVQGSLGQYFTHNVNPTAYAARASNSRGLVYPDSSGAENTSVLFDDFDSSGFSATPKSGTISGRFFYLALKVGAGYEAKSAWDTTPTSTGTKTFNIGMQPSTSLWIPTALEALNTAYTNDLASAVHIGNIDSSNAEACGGGWSVDNVNPADSIQIIRNDSIFSYDDARNQSPSGAYNSNAATGPELDFSAVETSGKYWLVAGIGAAAAGNINSIHGYNDRIQSSLHGGLIVR